MRSSSPRKYYQNPQYQQQAHRYDGKCVCEICDCEQKHKCPAPGFRLQTETTNRHDYVPHQISPQKYQRQVYQPNNSRYQPADLVTTYRDFYHPHDLNAENVRPRTAKPQYSPSKFKFEGETEYKNKYSPERLKTEQPTFSPRKRREWVPSPDKFEGTTTYRDEYSPKKAEGSPSPRRQKNEYSPSKFPLQTETTYNNFYKPHKIESSPVRARAKDNLGLSPDRPKFQGQTRYRQFFPVREIKPVKRCPADILPQRPYRCSPDKYHTHFNAQGNRWA